MADDAVSGDEKEQGRDEEEDEAGFRPGSLLRPMGLIAIITSCLAQWISS